MLQAAAVAAAAAAANGTNDNYFSNLQQQQQQQQTNQYHQELVKSYLNNCQQQQQTSNILSSSSSSSSSSTTTSSSSLMSPVSLAAAATSGAGSGLLNGGCNNSGSMVSLASRLMSLNSYELKCLNADNELMRRINEMQSLVESRLNDIHSSKNNRSQHNQQQLNKIYQQQLSSPLNLNLKPLPLQEQQQQFLLSSPSNNCYYQNYYQLFAQQQMAQFQQQQQQQQQLYLLNSRFNSTINDQQQQQNGLSTSTSTTSSGVTPQQQHHARNQKAHSGAQQAQQQNTNPNRLGQPALDLRTTPTRPISVSPLSPISSRAASTGSVASNSTTTTTNRHHHHEQQTPQQQHPKKMKLSEYCRKQQQEHQNDLNYFHQQQQAKVSSSPYGGERIGGASSEYENNVINSFHNNSNSINNNNKRPYPLSNEVTNLLLATGAAATNSCEINGVGIVGGGGNRSTMNSNKTMANNTIVGSAVVVKKYKGEFDEPSPDEVAQRQMQLNRPNHYHKDALEKGECACVIGSEFRDKTKQDALQLLDNWRALDIAERIKWKWDVNDLPKDIPLSDIKKFEDLRRDFSLGRADFGGASKRKPLGIRGTRQFLLMLYCLWGHPGRDDPMQQDGYCPHCFARIRTENEQSTLVRVVNHFNMKHRRGANPRLSPRLEAAATLSQTSTSLAHNISKPSGSVAANLQQQSGLEEEKTSPSSLGEAKFDKDSCASMDLPKTQSESETTASSSSDAANKIGLTNETTAIADAQSPHLEVAHTLLSMVESAAKDGQPNIHCEKGGETNNLLKQQHQHQQANNINNCNGGSGRSDLKSPELDSENLDPRCSMSHTADESNDTILAGGHDENGDHHVNNDGDGLQQSQLQGTNHNNNSVIKKETVDNGQNGSGGGDVSADNNKSTTTTTVPST